MVEFPLLLENSQQLGGQCRSGVQRVVGNQNVSRNLRQRLLQTAPGLLQLSKFRRVVFRPAFRLASEQVVQLAFLLLSQRNQTPGRLDKRLLCASSPIASVPHQRSLISGRQSKRTITCLRGLCLVLIDIRKCVCGHFAIRNIGSVCYLAAQ